MSSFYKNCLKIIVHNNKKNFYFFLLFMFIFINLVFLIISLLNGYQKYIFENLMVNSFHIEIFRKDGKLIYPLEIDELKKDIKKIAEVTKIYPFSNSQALLKKNGYYTGVSIFSFDYSEKWMERYIEKGEYIKGKIILGKGVMEDFKLDIGDKVMLANLEEKQSFEISGYFRTGIYDMDYLYLLMDNNAYSKFYIIPDGYSKIGIYIDDIYNSQEILNKIKKNYTDYDGNTIFAKNDVFLKAINSEKLISLIISCIITFLLLISTWLFIISRINFYRKEIAFILSQGVPVKKIVSVFGNIFSVLFGSIYLFSAIFSYCLLSNLNGKITIPQEVYIVDKLYMVFDIKYFNILTFIYIVFFGIMYSMFYFYFKNIKIEDELRSN